MEEMVRGAGERREREMFGRGSVLEGDVGER